MPAIEPSSTMVYRDDRRRRSAISSFALVPAGSLDAGLERLAAGLRSGDWERQHGQLRARSNIDLGYRILVREAS
jgi:hypothetical protein